MKADFLPEEREYLRKTKLRRIKEGMLYFIDSMMKPSHYTCGRMNK